MSQFDINTLFPSLYLSCEDLHGRNVTVRLQRCTINTVERGKTTQQRLVFTLTHPDGKPVSKKLVVGRTNGQALAVLLGSSDAEQWCGKLVTLCPDLDRFAGQDVGTIRIAGSPDATPARAAAYERAWKGDRAGGALCNRLKAARQALAVTPAAAPVTPAPAPVTPRPVPVTPAPQYSGTDPEKRELAALVKSLRPDVAGDRVRLQRIAQLLRGQPLDKVHVITALAETEPKAA